MIFVTVGSSTAGFDRLMRALEVLPASDLIVQHGPSKPPPCAAAHDFLPFGRMVELMQEADVLVIHAGVGSIMCALQAGHRPIVFPRLARHGETVDDHQAELASELARRGTVVVATGPDELLAAVRSAPGRCDAEALGGHSLNAAVRAAIHGEGPRTLRRRLPSQPATFLNQAQDARQYETVS